MLPGGAVPVAVRKARPACRSYVQGCDGSTSSQKARRCQLSASMGHFELPQHPVAVRIAFAAGAISYRLRTGTHGALIAAAPCSLGVSGSHTAYRGSYLHLSTMVSPFQWPACSSRAALCRPPLRVCVAASATFWWRSSLLLLVPSHLHPAGGHKPSISGAAA